MNIQNIDFLSKYKKRLKMTKKDTVLEKYTLLLNFTISDERANTLNAIKNYDKNQKIIKKIAQLFRSKHYKKDVFFKTALDHEWKGYIDKFVKEEDTIWQAKIIKEMLKNKMNVGFLHEFLNLTEKVLLISQEDEVLHPNLAYIFVAENGFKSYQNLSYLDKKIEIIKDGKRKEIRIIDDFLDGNFNEENKKVLIDYAVHNKIYTPEQLVAKSFSKINNLFLTVCKNYSLDFNNNENNKVVGLALETMGYRIKYLEDGVDKNTAEVQKYEFFVNKVIENNQSLIFEGQKQAKFVLWKHMFFSDGNIDKMVKKYDVFDNSNNVSSIFEVSLEKTAKKLNYFLEKALEITEEKNTRNTMKLNLEKYFEALKFLLEFKKSDSIAKKIPFPPNKFDSYMENFISGNRYIDKIDEKILVLEKFLLKLEHENNIARKTNKL